MQANISAVSFIEKHYIAVFIALLALDCVLLCALRLIMPYLLAGIISAVLFFAAALAIAMHITKRCFGIYIPEEPVDTKAIVKCIESDCYGVLNLKRAICLSESSIPTYACVICGRLHYSDGKGIFNMSNQKAYFSKGKLILN